MNHISSWNNKLNTEDLQKKYDRLEFRYLNAQAFSYLLTAIFCINVLPKNNNLVFLGWIFFASSVLILFSEVNPLISKIAAFVDTVLEGGLFVASLGAIIVDGFAKAIQEQNDVFGYIIIGWLVILIVVGAYRTYKFMGVYRTISFGMAAFGLIMLISGEFKTIYELLTLIGLTLSVPAVDEMLNDHIFRDQ